jgi:phosphatidylserine/phosphatidylglycerophosphate/cardiolipin synthase-like enzyme
MEVDQVPILDAVERELKELSPGLKGIVWERTQGNALDVPEKAEPDAWILQTPGLWGWTKKSELDGTHPGIAKLLAKITANISQAKHCVDISAWGIPHIPFAPAGAYPDGQFLDAMCDGLRIAATNLGSSPQHRLKVRLLTGVLATGLGGVSPGEFLTVLNNKIGKTAGDIDFNVAAMTTDTPRSQNHSKLIVVDGNSVICGGINWMSNFYIQDGDWSVKGGLGGRAPVTDLDIAVRGPAALSAGKFLDRLWGWACANKDGKAQIASSLPQTGLIPALYGDVQSPAVGALDVISVGSLGYGIQVKDEESKFVLPAIPQVEQAAYKLLFGAKTFNHTNTDRDWMTVNPDANVIRVLIENARKKVVLSQQDINGFSALPLLQPLFDVRLVDALVLRATAGVQVRIVLSTPGRPDYSNIEKITEAMQSLRDRAIVHTGSEAAARKLLGEYLQLTTLRVSDAPAWLDGTKYRLHTKLVCVDDRAFYVGSKNAYPDTTQDHGFVIEDEAAAQQLNQAFLEPQWKYSQANICKW